MDPILKKISNLRNYSRNPNFCSDLQDIAVEVDKLIRDHSAEEIYVRINEAVDKNYDLFSDERVVRMIQVRYVMFYQSIVRSYKLYLNRGDVRILCHMRSYIRILNRYLC